MTAIPAVSIKNLSKTFTTNETTITALSNINVNIQRGSLTGLIGADGAGKTTLMRLLAGLLTYDQGEIIFNGQTDVGYMPQQFGLYEDLSVIENLILYADLRGVVGEERKKEFSRLLHFTDLTKFTDRPSGKLSGGMKQKLGLACALLGHPSLLLLDEPSVGVDPVSRRELWTMVNALIKEGITVIWSTSYLDEAERCDEVILLNESNILYNGSPKAMTAPLVGRSIQIQDITTNHRHVLQRAIQDPAVMDGVIQGRHVRLLLRKENQFPDLNKLNAGESAHFVVVTPRFEDAFIDKLGGAPGGESLLASKMHCLNKTSHENVIVADRLTKKFGDFYATHDISFAIKRGEIFGLLGPNGAGKSTTFKMLCGLLTPTKGNSAILGINLQKQPSIARQQIGYMAQKFSLYGDLSVEQNLVFFSGIYGLHGEKQKTKIQEMIQTFDLQSYLSMTTHELPLGFKQRLALACAVMHEPAILFLDEPTSGVDPITRREFWMHINGLVEKGVTVIITTHFMDEAEYCDRISLIYHGEVIASGSPETLKQQASTTTCPDPTMEESFIQILLTHDKQQPEEQTLTQTPSFNLGKQTQSPSFNRFLALCKKEYYQIYRDPSNFFMAFVLPMMMLFIYGFGLNLDTAQIKIGLVMEEHSPEVRKIQSAFTFSPNIDAITYQNREQAELALTAGHVKGIVVFPEDLSRHLKQSYSSGPIQILTDGADTNTANFVVAAANGAISVWQKINADEKTLNQNPAIKIENRYWFNPAVISRHFLVPGSIVIIMTVIGALLTSLVVAREWERGTMEALLSTPMKRIELLASKFFPYFTLGLASMAVCTITAITLLDTPFRGSFTLLFLESSLFISCVLGIGLFLSTVIRNQFNAAQAALNLAYMPAILLSGFVFEINSMPPFIQAITYLFPARYFVSALQTLFLAGDITKTLLIDAGFLFVYASIFLLLAYKMTRRKLDGV